MSEALLTYRLPGRGDLAPATVTQWQGTPGAIGYVTAAALAQLAEQARPRLCTHRRMGWPRETAGVAEMAAVYNEHLASGKPTAAVRQAFPHYCPRTIGSRIRLARQQGLIAAPAPRGGRPRKNPAS
jgi:hypothetical protein